MTIANGQRFALWLSTPNVAAVEIAAACGYAAVILDLEHGAFDPQSLDTFIPLARAFGLEVTAKVIGAERSPIQQALDLGADAVAIPHVLGVDHARVVTGFAKFPPKGDRSYAGGRTTGYRAGDRTWIDAQDAQTRCYAMIEDAAALEQVRQIVSLETVDGLFVGPADLSLRRQRGAYCRSAADYADLEVIAAAAAEVGKPWIFPAWTAEEQRFGLAFGAACIAVTTEHTAVLSGLSAALATARELETGVVVP